MDNQWVVPLRMLSRDDLALAGGKGANLGELLGSGFRVPDGFVVTTTAYADLMERTGLGDRIAEHVTGGDEAADIRADIQAVSLPDELRAAVASAYAELGGGPVAVRSSATAEDLPGAAFAGQQDTYLNVTGDPAVLDAVRRCWASLWTDRAIAYRRRRGIDSEHVQIAVIVQQMIDADAAGVMFTANPITGDRDQIMIDAAAGLGEAVVSGLVTPEHYVLDANGTLREWSAGQDAHDRLLTDEVRNELARTGTAIARHFGRPQDIEWAWTRGDPHPSGSRRSPHTRDGVWVLQARPMTALPPPPLRLNRRQRLLGSVLLELLPIRPYPIDMTTWVSHGPAGLMKRVTASFGIRGAFEGFLHEESGVVDRLIPPSPRPTRRVLAAPFLLIHKARRYDPSRWTQDPRFVTFRSRADELAGRDLTAMPWAQLTAVPRQALDLVTPIADLRIDYLPRLAFAMLRLLVIAKLAGRHARLGDLTTGSRTRTEDANRALEALAEQVRINPTLSRAFADLEPEQLLDVAAGDAQFHAELTSFLAEYGHRETATPLLVTPPTWADAPEIVLGLVKLLAVRPPSPTSDTRADRALQRLVAHPLLRGSIMRARVRRWVEAARSGIAFRDDSHFFFTKPLPILRRSLLEIGRRMCDAGVLRAPQEVFHLRLEELEAVADIERLAEPDAERLRAAVRRRSAKREELAGVPLIAPSLIYPSSSRDGALVTGTPASGGTATGPARIIGEPAEFPNLRSGDILVCPYTNPSWTPLFQRAAAVVADSGGAGSHAAIVAREYGIPAVMGTGTGTTVLNDGQLVTVNGSTGRVVSAEGEGERQRAGGRGSPGAHS